MKYTFFIYGGNILFFMKEMIYDVDGDIEDAAAEDNNDEEDIE